MTVNCAMEIMFGERYVLDEWAHIVDPLNDIFEASEEIETVNLVPELVQVFDEALKCQGLSLPPPMERSFGHYDGLIEAINNEAHWASAPQPKVPQKRRKMKSKHDDLRALDFGVIDLTTLAQNDDSTSAGPSKVSHKREDIIRLDSPSPGPLQREISVRRSLTPTPGSSNKRRRDADE